MITKNLLLREFIVNGATKRLEELNKEIKAVQKIIDNHSDTKIPVLKKHWTQTAKGRKRLAEIKEQRRAK